MAKTRKKVVKTQATKIEHSSEHTNELGGTKMYRHYLVDNDHNGVNVLSTRKDPYTESGTDLLGAINNDNGIYIGDCLGLTYQGSSVLKANYLATGSINPINFDSGNYTDEVKEI